MRNVRNTNMKTAKVIGIYPVEAPDPCHLIEISISGGDGIFDVGSITQEDPTQTRDNWQCPYMERLISADGTTILTEPFEAEDDEDKWIGEYRIGFFFHLLDTSKPLITPFGELTLPPETELPTRLADYTYEEP